MLLPDFLIESYQQVAVLYNMSFKIIERSSRENENGFVCFMELDRKVFVIGVIDLTQCRLQAKVLRSCRDYKGKTYMRPTRLTIEKLSTPTCGGDSSTCLSILSKSTLFLP
jgi:hypothetical protein